MRLYNHKATRWFGTGVRRGYGVPGYRYSYRLWGGALVVMPWGCRLWPNLVNKYRTSSIVYDRALSSRLDLSTLPLTRFSNKWYQEPWLDWIARCAKDHMEARGSCSTGAR